MRSLTIRPAKLRLSLTGSYTPFVRLQFVLELVSPTLHIRRYVLPNEIKKWESLLRGLFYTAFRDETDVRISDVSTKNAVADFARYLRAPNGAGVSLFQKVAALIRDLHRSERPGELLTNLIETFITNIETHLHRSLCEYLARLLRTDLFGLSREHASATATAILRRGNWWGQSTAQESMLKKPYVHFLLSLS